MAVQPIAVGAAVAVSADTNPRPIAVAPIAVPIAVVPIAIVAVPAMVTTDVTCVMSANWVTYVSIMGQSDRTAACRIAIN